MVAPVLISARPNGQRLEMRQIGATGTYVVSQGRLGERGNELVLDRHDIALLAAEAGLLPVEMI